MHFLKIFLAGAFVFAAGLRALMSAAGLAIAHLDVPALPTLAHSNVVEAIICLLGGLFAAVWSEAHSRSHR
jgi:hypothetical protein